jgi:hypothetical protein
MDCHLLGVDWKVDFCRLLLFPTSHVRLALARVSFVKPPIMRNNLISR